MLSPEAYMFVLDYFHIFSQRSWFSKTLIEYEIRVFIFSETVKYFSSNEEFTDVLSWIYAGLL